MLLFVWRDDRLPFPVLMTLLLFMGMMAKPGFALLCIKCDGEGCEKPDPDASKATPCDYDWSCWTYGKPGSVSRGCTTREQKDCIRRYSISGPHCFDREAFFASWYAEEVEECLRGIGGPADGKLDNDKKICYCPSDNCNNADWVIPPKPKFLGTPMKHYERRCYECKGRPDGDCALAANLGQREVNCEGGVCTKRSNKFDHYIIRSCDKNMTQERFDCLKKAYGKDGKDGNENSFCISNDDLHDEATPNNKEYDQCLRQALPDLFDTSDTDGRRAARSGKEIPEESLCFCDRDNCNPSDHSSPNNKLIIPISLILATAFAFIPL